jgi:poly(A) polymerase
MLRAIRFSTQLGFPIEPATWSAVCRRAKQITNISGERIAVELEGILAHPNRADGASMLIESGLAEVVFPGFEGKQAKIAITILSQLPKRLDFPLTLAAFFAGFETEFAIERCRILKLGRNQNKHIKFLLADRGKLLDENMSLAELKKTLAQPYFWDLYELQKAIQKTTDQSTAALTKLRKRIKALGDVDLQPKPLLNGHDLIRLGATPGPTLGQLAEEMYIAQLEGILQTAQQAQEWAHHWLQKHKSS